MAARRPAATSALRGQQPALGRTDGAGTAAMPETDQKLSGIPGGRGRAGSMVFQDLFRRPGLAADLAKSVGGGTKR